MKKFLVTFFKLLLVLVVLSVLLNAIVLKTTKPDYRRNEIENLVQKMDAFEADGDSINTVFIGTSRSYRHISPMVFDSITNEHSYNMAFEGLYPFRSYDLINKFIKSSPRYKEIENVFIEIAPLDAIAENSNNNAFVNSITLKKYSIAVKSVLSRQFPIKNKLYYIYYYTKLCVYKYMGFGLIARINQSVGLSKALDFKDKPSQSYRAIVAANEGFLSLDDEQRILRGNKVLTSRKEFIKNATGILKQFKQQYPQSQNQAQEDVFDRYIINNAKALQRDGKKVYFILPPRQLDFSTKYLLEQKAVLEKSGFTVFDFSDPVKYPQFYSFENSFDKTHLNKKGALIYSELLAKQSMSIN